MTASPSIPLDFDPLVPPGAMEGATTLEEGAIRRLLRHAWRADPPCTLVADEGSLAILAGLVGAEWEAVRARVFMVFSLSTQHRGRVEALAAQKLHDMLARRTAHRSQSGKLGAEARWADGKAMANASACHAGAIPGGTARSLNPLSALRSSAQEGTKTNQSALMRAPSALSAGAQSAETAKQRMLRQARQTERQVVFGLLRAAYWPWAGPRHQRLAPQVVRELSENPNATIRQTHWALAWAAKLEHDADSQAREITPVRRVIGCIERPVEPDIFWASEYAKRPDPKDVELERLRASIARLDDAAPGTFKITHSNNDAAQAAGGSA